jgi:shikimate dehydrogenase
MRSVSKVAAVIGDPVLHSRSPAIHNAAFAATGLDWTYMAFEIPEGQATGALEAMRMLGLGGLSVTMPHKAAVANEADEVSDAVALLGAANCVVPLPDRRLRAENTDVGGFLAGLLDDAGITPEGRKVAVLGAGGAARAVVHAAHVAGASDIAIVNRSAGQAEIAAKLAPPTSHVGTLAHVENADIVVNATSVGMTSGRDGRVVGGDRDGLGAMPCPVELIGEGQVAVDLVYRPLVTAWVEALRERQVEAYNGLSMLVHQAAEAFELWTGVAAPIEVMKQAAAPTTAGRI